MCNQNFTVIHTLPDGQVFAVEQLGANEFQTVYPKQWADCSATWGTEGAAEQALRDDMLVLGVQ